jgi:hypothetical protein
MDLGEKVQATRPVSFEFLGETNTAEVYTAGIARLTSGQVRALQNATNEDQETLQVCIPLIVKSWDVIWTGDPLPIDSIKERNEAGEFLYPIPLAFIDALWKAAEGVFVDPTKASESPAGLAPEASVGEQAAPQ